MEEPELCAFTQLCASTSAKPKTAKLQPQPRRKRGRKPLNLTPKERHSRLRWQQRRHRSTEQARRARHKAVLKKIQVLLVSSWSFKFKAYGSISQSVLKGIEGPAEQCDVVELALQQLQRFIQAEEETHSKMLNTLKPLEDICDSISPLPVTAFDNTLSLDALDFDCFDVEGVPTPTPMPPPEASCFRKPAQLPLLPLDQQHHCEPSLTCSLLPTSCELMLLDISSSNPRLLDCSPSVRARLQATSLPTIPLDPALLFQCELQRCPDQSLMQTVQAMLLHGTAQTATLHRRVKFQTGSVQWVLGDIMVLQRDTSGCIVLEIVQAAQPPADGRAYGEVNGHRVHGSMLDPHDTSNSLSKSSETACMPCALTSKVGWCLHDLKRNTSLSKVSRLGSAGQHTQPSLQLSWSL
jgi:hypothetical protein